MAKPQKYGIDGDFSTRLFFNNLRNNKISQILVNINVLKTFLKYKFGRFKQLSFRDSCACLASPSSFKMITSPEIANNDCFQKHNSNSKQFTNSNSCNCMIQSFHTPSQETINYEELLKTITTLQSDLQNSASISSEIKRENEELKLKYQDLTDTLKRTRQRNKETNDSFVMQISQSIEKEKTMEASISNLEKQVQTYRAQILTLEASKSMFSKDQLRQEMGKENEVKYASIYSNDKNQIEDWRKKFLDAKRDMERCQVEFLEYRDISEKNMKSIKTSHDKQLDALRCERFNFFQKEVSSISHLKVNEKTHKTLEQEIEELRIKEKEILDENDTITQKYVEEERSKQKLFSKYKMELTKMNSDLALQKTANSRLRNKFQILEEECMNLRKELADAIESQNLKQEENTCLKDIINNEKRKVKSLMDKIKQASDRDLKLHEIDRDHLNMLNKNLKQELANKSTELKNFQSKVMANAKSLMNIETKIKKESEDKIMTMQKKNEKLEKQIHEILKKMRLNDMERQTQVEELICENNKNRIELNNIREEKDIIHGSLIESQNISKELKSKISSADTQVSMLVKEMDVIQKELTQNKEKNTEMQHYNERLQEKIKSNDIIVDKLEKNAEIMRYSNEQKISELLKQKDNCRKAAKVNLRVEVSTVFRFL